MKIAFNPSTVAALITPPNNKDITFDLRGRNIFARGVKFCGTDTWRDIKINNVSIGSNILDLRNGSNTTLTNTNGVVTINSTWRPVVDNLTSDSTTSSLSAKQGKILKSLIDGKSNSGHTHDDRYLRLTGGTMAGNALITFADSSSWGTDKGPQGARGGLYWTGQSDYAKLYAEETAGDNLDLVIQFGDDNSNGLSIRNKANTQTSYISAGGVITTGTFKGNLDWSYITNKPSSYTPSAHTHAWNSLTHSSTTENQAILTNGKANGWKLYTLNISRWDNAANNAHSHANKSVLDGITSALVNNWNIAYNFVHTITETDTDKVINKWDEIVNFLAGITEDNKLNTLLNSKLSIQQLSTKDILTTKTNNALFWVNTIGTASSITTGPFTDHPYALLSVTNYNQNTENSKFFYRSRLAFSSTGDIKVASCHHENVYKQDETWYNVLTSKNSGISGSTIKLNGTSITVYSSSTADGRYVKKTGDTMSGTLTIDTTNFGALTIKRNDDANGASIQFRGKSSVYGYIGLNNSTKDKQFLRWNSDTSKTYTILDTSSTYTSNGKGVINGTTITQVDNATNSTNSTNARKLVNWYSTRPTSLNAQFGDGSLRIFYATSSTTEGKPAEDSHILHLAWDNNGGWDAQLAVHTRSGKVSTRAQNSGTWQPWKTLAFTTDIPSSLKNPYSLNVFGVTYDGSAAKVVSPSNFISQVNEAPSTVTDGTMLITSWASNSGFADTNAVNIPYKRKAIHLWEYIKAKTDSLYATKGHNHDDRYLKLTGGTMSGAIYRNSGGSTISGRDHAIIRQTHAPGGSSWNPIACVDTETGTWTLGHLSSGSNNTDFNFCFSTNADYNAGNNNGNYVTLRNKVGTIALLSDVPSSLKNPHALTISLNGTSQGPYDGSAAKNINITPNSIGAAVSNHSHDYLVVNAADDKSFNSAYHNFQVLYAGGGNGITGKPANVDAFGLFKFRVASGWSGQMLLANGGSLYIRSSEDAKITNTLAWKTILDSSNYSGILDSRYYTESEVNSLLDAKLNRQNLSYGTWNPRGYNLAADYYYNGGDLSISESGGKIHISVDGYFWQNEGQYRVLDTSDISSIRGGLTLYQHLSATDTTRYPLVWGGSDHKNTNNSTGSLYKSYDKLSWQTSSQTLYATNIQTENIKHLSIEGGIYWNPYVESTTDGSDSASITLVRQGVAGGTTLVLSQMNDANDTIQFKTNGSARLYHNSYPILTTQNTYVSNNKGYINGTEITQVNNADKVDNRHAISTTPNTGIIYKAAIYTSSSLTSYWVRLASISSISQNAEFIATIHVQSGHSNPGRSAILLVYLRGSASSFISKSFKIYCNSNYDPNRFRLYYKDSDKTSEIWYQTTGQWDGIITTVISQSSEGSLYEGLTLYNGSITAVQTPSMSTYLSAQVSTITDNILGNAATATKLQTARSIWGHSFNGTADINGTIYINNNNSSEGAIRLNNNINSNARISAIDSQVIFNTDAAIRFGGTSWDWNVWAGLKYTHSNKTIYLGIADGSVFNANSAQSGGSLRFPGISNVYATTFNGSLSGNASTATNADKVDGYHANSFLIDRGGNYKGLLYDLPCKSIFSGNNLSDAPTTGWVSGIVLGSNWNSSHYQHYLVEIDSRWYTTRIYSNSKMTNWNTFAYLTDNVASATKLQTPRTIWGQSFDGTANISGTLSGVAHIQFSADNTYNIGSNSAASKYIYTYWLGAKSGQKLELGANNSGYGQGLCIDTNLNVGIGTNTPTYKLHVNGTFRATNSTVSDLFVNTGDATLKIYTGITTDAQNDGNICFQTSIDATDGQSHAHPTQYQSRCNIVLQPRGGQVYIGTNPGTGNTTYKLYVNSKIFSNGGFVKNGSSDSYVLLGGGGHKAVSAFAPSSHSHNYAANENYGGFTKSGRLPISGFYQSNASESGGNAPWSGWMHLINCQHSNTGNNYALQIAASFSNNNTFKIRVTNNNVNNAWRDIIHSGNIGSQSVAYASKAGSVAWDSITGKPSSFTPSAHTHSWTSITDKLVAGNEFNIVNAGFNNRMWFNYVPINDRSKTATILDYGFGNGHQGYATVTASGFVKNGSSSNYVLLGDGGHKAISDFATSGHTHSSITIPICSSLDENSDVFRIEYAVGSNSIATKPSGVDAFGVIRLRTAAGWYGQIMMSANTAPGIYYRNANGLSSSVGWKKLLDSSNFNSYSPKLDGTGARGTWGINITGNADTVDGFHANGLLTALSNSNNGVSITIGGTTKSISNISVNHANSAGSANTATKLTSSAGNAALPIYFSDGKPVACTASSVFSNLSNSGNNLSITVAGQNRTLTVGYATSAGSTTKVIVNQHTTNDTNYPLVWSNQNNSNNATENQLYKSWSDLYYNPKNKRLTVGGSVVASSFIKSGGTSQQLLRADGGIATFNWSGQSGQPTWLWGGNNQHSYYVYNPSNFRVAYATSAGSADTLDGVHLSGIFTAFGNNGHNITATIGGTTKSFLVNWAADSDKLDGYHASNLLTSVTNTNNGISVTVGGTTKSVSNISVNYATSSGNADTAQYLRSLGNQNCQTGRTQNYGDVYTYNTYANNTGAPTSYTSVIGFGRGIAGTVEIAGGWDNTNLYWRSLRDCCEDWYSWRTVLDSSNYTEFINNYYWANVKISTSSSTTTSPTVSNLTATSSIRMGNIYLQNTNEINSASGIHLNYQNSGNISLCAGGGNVGIGTISPAYKLDVNGQVRASGFRHSSVNSDNYVLLAGGGYKSFGGDSSHPVFLGYLNLDHGSDGTVSSSFYCLGYSVPFTYTRGGNYCKISIPDTTHQAFYIKAATASVNYSGGGMDTWTGDRRGAGAWWLHCYASSSNEVRVKGFCQKDTNNDSWWGGNPLWSDRSGANRITVCIFGYVTFR